jgi:hypothetical protein
MREIFSQIDRLLRGHYTSEKTLRSGTVAARARPLLLLGIALGSFYGLCMSIFVLLRHEEPTAWYLPLVMLKVPALLVLTLLVTAPSLYVFSALGRSRLDLEQTLRLLLAGTAVLAAVLASLGPVTIFFTLCTKSYPFMLLLNALVFAISGLVAIGFLSAAVRVAFEPGEGPTKTTKTSSRARTIFRFWLVIYGVVGAQMAWILRPFIGDPGRPLEVFRETESHFLRGLLDAIRFL